MQDQSPLKNLLYNISVPPPMIKHKDMIQDQLNTPHDTVVEVLPCHDYQKHDRQRSTSKNSL